MIEFNSILSYISIDICAIISKKNKSRNSYVIILNHCNNNLR